MTSNSPLRPYKNVLPVLQRVSKARVRLGPPSYSRKVNSPVQGEWRFLPPSLVAQVGLLRQRLLLVGQVPPWNWETLGFAVSIGPNLGWQLPALFPWIIPRPYYIHSLRKRLNALCMIHMLYGYTLPGLCPFPLFGDPWVVPQSITHARLTSHILHCLLEGTKERLGCLAYLVLLFKYTRPDLQPHLRATFLLQHLGGKQKGPHGREAKLSFRELCGEYSPSPLWHRMHGYCSRTQTTLIVITQPLRNLGKPHVSLMVPAWSSLMH